MHFLKRELVHLRLFERDVVIRLHHSLLLCVLIGLAVGLGLGFLGGYAYPYKTVAPPPVPPGQVIPRCDNNANLNHVKGECLPKPKAPTPPTYTVPHADVIGNVQFAASIEQSQTGPDLSNNDPVFGDGNWSAIAGRSSFAIFKVWEGSSFHDCCDVAMGRYARAHGLAVGGYDFAHVCGVDASYEANRFTDALIADGLDPRRAGTLPATLDAEFGGDGCNARAWVSTWMATVQSRTGRQPMIYTGAWWWDPHLGCWWPGGMAWISGYTGSLGNVPRPCGQGHIDLWQFADNWWNGANSGDGSLWLDGNAAFHIAAGGSGPPPDPYAVFPKAKFAFGKFHFDEYSAVKSYDQLKCRYPLRRAACQRLGWEIVLLDQRLVFVAWNHRVNGHWVRNARPDWKTANRGSRNALMGRRKVNRNPTHL